MNLATSKSFRRSIYVLLAIVSTVSVTGRIFSIKSQLGGTPLLSANDRSRWSTIRALVDHGTFEIDDVVMPNGKHDREWYTIDMVRHRGVDGQQHYYSSKPPLLATMIAAKYWVLQRVTGVNFADHPFYIGRVLLFTTNVLPLILYFVLISGLVERLGVTDWGRVFVFASTTWGTFLTTFAVTLNNHLPAAIGALIAVAATLRVTQDRSTAFRDFAIAGGFAAFTVANELPALSLFVCLFAWLMWRSAARTTIAFVPAAALVFAVFFGTNYAAHRSWRPPYAHRDDGRVLATCEIDRLPSFEAQAVPVPAKLRQAVPFELSESATLTATPQTNRWVIWDAGQQRNWAVLAEGDGVSIREWDNWYDYPKSYWTEERRRGVDQGEKSQAVYAFHTILGHRGILSLTPIWILSGIGVVWWLAGPDRGLRVFAGMVLLLTCTCLAFYISRPLVDRNYGGIAAGFRWMFWFTPLWLVTMIPAADVVARNKWARFAACSLLAVSVFSATYPFANPWTQSWIFDYWTQLGWIAY